MAETLRGEVIHVVDPAELDEYELDAELRSLADSRYVIVCREGGSPSWFERVRSFFTRKPIEAVTLVSDRAASEGSEVTATVRATDISGVYEATELEAAGN
jgi:chemotaxis signal transduction protein